MDSFLRKTTQGSRIGICNFAPVTIMLLSLSAWAPLIFGYRAGFINIASWGIAGLLVTLCAGKFVIRTSAFIKALVFATLVIFAILIRLDSEFAMIGSNLTIFLTTQALIVAILIRASQRAHANLGFLETVMAVLNILISAALFLKASKMGSYNLNIITSDWSFKIKWFDLIFLYIIFVDRDTKRWSRIALLLSCTLLSFLVQSKIGMSIFLLLTLQAVNLATSYQIKAMISVVALIVLLILIDYIDEITNTLVWSLQLDYFFYALTKSLATRTDIFSEASNYCSINLLGNFGWQSQIGDYDGRGARFGLYIHSIVGIAMQFGVPALLIYLSILFVNAREIYRSRTRVALVCTIFLLAILLLVRPIFSIIALSMVWIPCFSFKTQRVVNGVISIPPKGEATHHRSVPGQW